MPEERHEEKNLRVVAVICYNPKFSHFRDIAVGREKFSLYPLRFHNGSLGIKQTKRQISRRQGFSILHAQGLHGGENSKKQLDLGAYIPF